MNALTAQLYVDFIRDTAIRYFDTNAPPGCKKIVLIHDNAPIHRGAPVTEVVRVANQHLQEAGRDFGYE